MTYQPRPCAQTSLLPKDAYRFHQRRADVTTRTKRSGTRSMSKEHNYRSHISFPVVALGQAEHPESCLQKLLTTCMLRVASEIFFFFFLRSRREDFTAGSFEQPRKRLAAKIAFWNDLVWLSASFISTTRQLTRFWFATGKKGIGQLDENLRGKVDGIPAWWKLVEWNSPIISG